MQIHTATGAAQGSDPKRVALDALAQARAGWQGEVELAICFCSSTLQLHKVLNAVSAELPKVRVVGATTAGEITDKGFTQRGLSLMLLGGHTNVDVETASLTTVSIDTATDRMSSRFADSRGAAMHRDLPVSTTMLLTDGMSGKGEALLSQVMSKSGALHEIVGGAAGDEGKFEVTYVGTRERVISEGAVAVHIGTRSRWGIGVEHGMSADTPPMRVTRAQGNVVHELDGKPAFEAYKAYALKKGVHLTPRDAGRFMIDNELGVIFFEQLKHVRAPLSVNKDGSLSCAAPVPQGGSVCIVGGSRPRLLEAARAAATEAKNRLGQRKAAGVLMFDCICRHAILGDDFDREIAMVKEVFPGTPIAGFLTYGEIARYSGKLDGWHNSTLVVAAIPE